MSAQKRDGIRVFAWIAIVAGCLVAVGRYAYYSFEMYEPAPHYYTAWQLRALEAINPWPAGGVGVAVAAFGVLLLAIRRPAS